MAFGALPIVGRVITVASPLGGPAAPFIAAGGQTISAYGEARRKNELEAKAKRRREEHNNQVMRSLTKKQSTNSKTDTLNTITTQQNQFDLKSLTEGKMPIIIGLVLLILIIASKGNA